MLGKCEEGVLGRRANIGEPVHRHADRQKSIVAQRGEQLRWRCCGERGLRRDEVERRGRGDVLDAFADFDDLHRAGARMRLDPPALGPSISVVMVIDIGDEHRLAGLVNDQPDVAVDPR